MPPSALPPTDHPLPFVLATNFCAPTSQMRRKTPSELRQEQLSRTVRPRNSQDGATGVLLAQGSAADQKQVGLRLVDTRVADIYAATKPHERPKFAFSKLKDDLNRALPRGSIATARRLRKHIVDVPGSLGVANGDRPVNDGKSLDNAKLDQTTEAPSGEFRDVTQLSSRPRPQALGLAADMAAALKVMASAAGKGLTNGTIGSVNVVHPSDSWSPTIDNDLNKSKTPPVDFSLKLSARFQSSDSLHWCHRISSRNEVEGVKLFVEKFKWNDMEDLACGQEMLGENRILERFGARFCQSLHSWVHPLPQCLELYGMALASARGDTNECTMVTTLYRMWEESFRSLYYMFCHKRCKLFYFCTQQFVVMFLMGGSGKGDENSSKAYWTRSTCGLRKRLQEQAVGFCMPFCTSEADMSSLEDLQELTELEKLNPGQTRLVDPRTAIDNSSHSLLAFEAANVHHLFDFLLNYRKKIQVDVTFCKGLQITNTRFLVGSVNATDFPVLYSPVEFCNASLYRPEVKCKRVQCSVENSSNKLHDQNGGSRITNEGAGAMQYTLELKGPPGAYITPWVIHEVCMVLEKSQKVGFEASFVTGPLTETLNVAQDISSVVGESSNFEKVMELESSRQFSADILNRKTRVVKHLMQTEGSYQAEAEGAL